LGIFRNNWKYQVNKQLRLNDILGLVVQRGSIDVDEAAQVLNVSLATVRRDFDALAKRQLLNRTHGGATATAGSFKLPLTYKIAKDDELKKAIAELAATLVSRYQVIGLNGGTTTTEVARAIVARSEFAPGDSQEVRPALTVVTNALNIATELTVRPQIKIVVTGGVARPQSYELTGPFAEAVLSAVNIDIAILGVGALDLINGAMAHHEDEARVNHQIASRAQKIVIVTQSEKFSNRTFASIIPASKIDVLVTDSGIPPQIAKGFEELGVEIMLVKELK